MDWSRMGALGKKALLGAVTAASLAMAGWAFAQSDAAEVRHAVSATLGRFHPTPLASSPPGIVEERAVWEAKLTALIADAPAMLRQSILLSKSQREFEQNLALLEQMQEGSLRRAATGVARGAPAPVGLTKGLGDPDNLTYRAITPCRIMDTRNAVPGSGVQGPIVGNVLRQLPGFVSSNSNWAIYGQPAPLSDCGLNNVFGPDVFGLAIVVTVLNPNANSYLGISDSPVLATVLSSVAVNFTGGPGTSSLFIVPQNNLTKAIYFALPPGVVINLIFDVVGTFARSSATALECVQIASLMTAVQPNVWTSIGAACPVGWSATGGGWDSDASTLNWPGVWVLSTPTGAGGWTTTVDNQTASPRNVRTLVQCCRVPGRTTN